MISVLILIAVTTALVPVELLVLNRLEPRVDRLDAANAARVPVVGTLVISLICVFLSEAVTLEAWPVFIAAPILFFPFIRWMLPVLRRARDS